MAGATVGGIAGYLLGVVLYINVLCSSVFAPSTSPILAFVTSAGVWPVMFSIFVAALGFFSGWYISHISDPATTTTSSITPETAQNIVAAIADLKSTLIAQSKHTVDAGPPKAPAATQ